MDDVDFINENEGWIAGYSGKATILHTANGGAFWMGQANPAIHGLWAIDMQGDGTGWAVGDRWTQLFTENYGNTWTRRDSLSGADYYSVHYGTEGKLWIAGSGGTMLHSPDGGETWVQQTIHSPDSGRTWLGMDQPPDPIHKVSFSSETHGWAVGAGGLLQYTTDGGGKWNPAGTVMTRVNLRGVHFANPDTGWVAGDYGVIMRTNNGGATWHHQAVVERYKFNDIHFVGVDSGWVAGNDGVVLRTYEGGEGIFDRWPTVSTPTGTTADLHAIHFPGGMGAAAVGHSGWAVGYTGVIIRTTNGANTWHAQNSGTQNHLYGVFFASRTSGWAVGLSGTVLRTSDGGENWTMVESGTASRLTSVFAVDSLNVWATGIRGTLIHSSDGGMSWQLQNTDTFETLNRVHFIDRNFGWAVGEIGTIIWTDDGGETWMQQTSGTNNRLSDIFFADVNNGWVVGEKGSILNTANGGLTVPAFVQIVHAAADVTLSIVDVYVNGTRVIDDLNYREASAKLAVPVDATIGIARGSSTDLGPDDPQFTVAFTPGETFAAVLAGEVGHSEGPLSLVTLPKKTSGKTLEPVSTGFVHAIVDGPPVDCYVNGVAVTSGLSFGESGVASSTSDRQVIHVKRHDDGSLIESFEVTLGTGSEAFPIILAGYLSPPPGSENRAMSMMIVSETGEVSTPAIVTSLEDDSVVREFKLLGNYPNPFNPTTTIRFDLPATSDVTLTVFDVLGRVVRRFERPMVPAGFGRSQRVDSQGLSSGVYVYRINAVGAGDVYTATGSMLLLR